MDHVAFSIGDSLAALVCLKCPNITACLFYLTFCVLLQDEFSVNIFEEVVRFHLLSEHELCEEEASSERRLFHVVYLLWAMLIASHVTLLPGSSLHALQGPRAMPRGILHPEQCWPTQDLVAYACRVVHQQAACLAFPSFFLPSHWLISSMFALLVPSH